MKEIMTFVIKVDPNDVTGFMSPAGGGACLIPFGGYVESELFTGKIRPGACDVQSVNPAGFRTMCASYVFEGKDSEGKDCHLYVQNVTCFAPDAEGDGPFDAYPTFITDSEKLAPYLHTTRFKSVGCVIDETMIHIKVYDLWED